MKKSSWTKILSAIVLLFSSFSCLLLFSPSVPLSDYSGRWKFKGSIYNDFDSTGYLVLKEDSTFQSDFSYFWDKDTSRYDSLSGKWYPIKTSTYKDNYYVDMHIIIDSIEKIWRVEGKCKSDTMTWYTDDYGDDPEIFWQIAK